MLLPLAKKKLNASTSPTKRLLDMAYSTWNTAANQQPDHMSLMRKLEALGIMCAAARHSAEECAKRGGSYAECVRKAANILRNEAVKLESM